MANKIVNIDQLEEDLTSIANALRAKDGSSELLQYPDDFISKLNGFYSAADFISKTKPSGIIYYEGTFVSSALFRYRTAITAFICPNITHLESTFARNCTGLTSVIMDKLTYISSYAFSGCTSMQVFCFPRLYIANTASGLGNCTNLTTVDFGGKNNPSSATIGNSVFEGDTKLSKIILRTTGIVWNLANTTVLNSTCFKSGGTGGTLYVPENLISQYEAHENWAVYLNYPNNKILPIEGSQYENYFADGRLISSVL